jgi:hypothetical protein
VNPTDYFAGAAFGGPGWLRWAMLGVLLLAVALGAVFFAEKPKHAPQVYSPRLAWLRAWLYYCIVMVFGWVTGVLGYVLEQPLVAPGRTDDTAWLVLVTLCWVAAVWGYVYWWPRGTLTHGRRLYLLPTLVHGTLWGVSGGLLYLSVYALLEQFQLPALVNAVLLVLILSVYSPNYQLGWWDIYVSPPHNIRATNNGKVAFAHQPFLLVTLTLFVAYGDAAMYMLLLTFALAASAVAMRFPPFWLPDGGPVSRETALGD